MDQAFQPLVSIVIPVFNGANYVREAIDSVLAQTYEHFEVIVVNDGSKDETEQIALSYREKIRYFSKENGGVSTALNMGIQNMRGEYFLWLSHDDLLKPDALCKMINLLTAKPSDGIVYGNFDFINEKSEVYQSNDFTQWFPQYLLEWSVFPVLTGLSNACVTLIHKRHFDRVGLFDESLLYSQDLVMLYKAFRGQALLFSVDFIGSKRFHQEQGQQIYRKDALQGQDKVFREFLAGLTPVEMCSFSGSVSSFAEYVNNIYGTSDHPLISEYLKQVIKSEKTSWYSDSLHSKFYGSHKSVSELEDELNRVYQSAKSVSELEDKLNCVYQSASWRITAPFRICGNILRSIKNYGFVNTCNKAYKRILKT